MLRLLCLALLAGCAGAPAGPPADAALAVRVVGTAPGDASQLNLAVRWVAPDGAEALPVELDDDDGAVALDGDRPLDENAVYFDPDSGELAIDLDALGPGDRTLRVQVRHEARSSPWLEVAVRDRRLAPGP